MITSCQEKLLRIGRPKRHVCIAGPMRAHINTEVAPVSFGLGLSPTDEAGRDAPPPHRPCL